ncbi:hypothetical protein JYU34_016861 [Plutella xylostella]|uniref:Uncharacterized protein n=1 Tax=Plutella xylostella TaxID=51655 RepID=A0ABQ7Q3N3_PLUXY|nr:hypothetical protein JYU34_016861 [Plutella xylostella]
MSSGPRKSAIIHAAETAGRAAAFPPFFLSPATLSRILSNKRHTVSAISETQLFISDKKAGIDRPLQIIIGNIYLGKVKSWTELDVHSRSLSRAGAVCREIEAYRAHKFTIASAPGTILHEMPIASPVLFQQNT